jgi:hypothetical protein
LFIGLLQGQKGTKKPPTGGFAGQRIPQQAKEITGHAAAHKSAAQRIIQNELNIIPHKPCISAVHA